MKTSGIYKIINRVNGKYYVGSSNDIKRRWYNHKIELRKNRHKNNHLQNAWNKYNNLNFEFVIIEETPKYQLLIVEQKYLDIAKTEKDKCYNLCFDAKSPMKGKNHSEISKLKISNSNKGKHSQSEENKTKHSSFMKGKFVGQKNPMYGRNRSGKNNPMYGKFHTSESNEKNRKSHLEQYNGNKNPMFGKHHSENSKEKIRKVLQNQTILSFKNIKTNETFNGIRSEFITKFELNKGNVWAMMHQRKSCKGWKLL